jgi:hypothetical protein
LPLPRHDSGSSGVPDPARGGPMLADAGSKDKVGLFTFCLCGRYAEACRARSFSRSHRGNPRLQRCAPQPVRPSVSLGTRRPSIYPTPCDKLTRRAKFGFSEILNQLHIDAILFRQEGRSRVVTNVGWDVVDARALAGTAVTGRVEPREGSQARTTNDARAYGKTVWAWHPLLMSSWWRRSRANRVDQP